MDLHPYKFEPIYKERIWGGRRLETMFRRTLPAGKEIGESWELADLVEGTSVVANGPAAGTTLTELTAGLGEKLLGPATAMPNGRFPLLLKLLDANDILSLQVHPDAEAARRIGAGAAMKTECWYVVASDKGFIYKGLRLGVTRDQFAVAVEAGTESDVVQRFDVAAGDFHFLPAGTVHALGPGVVVAEVQTPSDTTYRVTDWGRGRETHLDLAMQCIHFEPAADTPPGADGNVLLATESFTVTKVVDRRPRPCGSGQCQAVMYLSGQGPLEIAHEGDVEHRVMVRPGAAALVPAGLDATITPPGDSVYLLIDVGGAV
ncbi:MAG TPA: type I phosphomannose isomerase catalytic subunit [Phycisphaerae bacterium]|nr:type I phosphomannose isomerase catalytic subunit [Phycisphaerae bacterium]